MLDEPVQAAQAGTFAVMFTPDSSIAANGRDFERHYRLNGVDNPLAEFKQSLGCMK